MHTHSGTSASWGGGCGQAEQASAHGDSHARRQDDGALPEQGYLALSRRQLNRRNAGGDGAEGASVAGLADTRARQIAKRPERGQGDGGVSWKWVFTGDLEEA